jgi:hypothetical protein
LKRGQHAGRDALAEHPPGRLGFDHDKSRRAGEGLRAFSRGVTLGEELTVRDLIREGRR